MPTRRLFFALWPPQSVRDQLELVARRLAPHHGRPVRSANLHLTLVFLGSVDDTGRRCMEQAADTVRGIPFTLELSRVGHWPRPRVLWLGAETTPPELERLAGDLTAALAVCGHRPESRPYRCHLTLARKVSRGSPVQTVEPIQWFVDNFCLVESVTAPGGAVYRVLNRWALSEAANFSCK